MTRYSIGDYVEIDTFWWTEGSLSKRVRNQTMRTIVKDKMLGWREVTSRVLQGLVLAPRMLQIYINDTERANSYVSLFVDAAELKKSVGIADDYKVLQEDSKSEWNQLWEMIFNTKKCKKFVNEQKY